MSKQYLLPSKSTEEIIRAFFNYDPNTGEIFWKEWISPEWYQIRGRYHNFLRDRAGKPVEFYTTSSNHLYVGAGGKTSIYAHQIAWVIMHGRMPRYEIDHIDGNPENNAIDNLRDVPRKINHRNQKMSRNNTSGVTGVNWSKQRQCWRASIMVDHKSKHLGVFDTIEEATEARQKFLEENRELGFTDRHGMDES